MYNSLLVVTTFNKPTDETCKVSRISETNWKLDSIVMNGKYENVIKWCEVQGTNTVLVEINVYKTLLRCFMYKHIECCMRAWSYDH